jgi:tRNA(Met) cytidine acetyltransferase
MMTQRQCLVLKGDSDWYRLSLLELQAEFDNDRIIYLSDHPVDSVLILPHKKAQSQLGKEFELVIIDASEQLDPDSLGAIIGTVVAGGTLIIALQKSVTASLWQKRFEQVISKFSDNHDSFMVVNQGQKLPKLVPPEQQEKSAREEIYRTEDQQHAVEAIFKVVHGHRRRPLVISSDRGRGKSAALGIAAAELILNGKTNIIVTASSMTTADTLFEHAARLLPQAIISQGHIQYQQADLQFIAPDALIASDIKTDLLLVDEAAAIPSSILEKLLQKFSRIVFATTLHGYEGTGRGFVIRFQNSLDKNTPNWHKLTLTTPIRWGNDDHLEAFSFEALLLNALPVDDELISGASVDSCEFELLDRTQLLQDEKSLRELFGLMVLAHYRTRPSDLQMMLDREDVSVYVMRKRGHIVASAWLVNEGELDDNLSTEVYAGNRRLKGHLLPQSLLAHVGLTNAGSLNYQRIIRIAVHPAIQGRGIGQRLLADIKKHVNQKRCDVLGASFAASTDLLGFWHKADYVPARLGIHQDDVSGSHAVMMLQACSEKGHVLIQQAQKRLQQQWAYLLSSHFNVMDAELLIAISQLILTPESQLSQWDEQDIHAFAYQQKGFEISQYSLALWMQAQIFQPEFTQLDSKQQQLCMMMILQQRDIAGVCKYLVYTGKKQVISALRVAVKMLLELKANKFHAGK